MTARSPSCLRRRLRTYRCQCTPPAIRIPALLADRRTIAFGGPREAPAQAAPVQWNGIDRVVAFADVHGAYAELLGLLRETGIVDAQDHWAAGNTHLVSLGDLLDRGADSRKVMDLLMRLQGEAPAAGGQVHVLLGNHEAMNLLGDLRYVDVRRVRRLRRHGVRRRARGACARRGRARKARIRRRLRPEISTRVFRAPRRFFAGRASTASGCWHCPWRSCSMTRFSCTPGPRESCGA